jgi:hypothetical protein
MRYFIVWMNIELSYPWLGTGGPLIPDLELLTV